MKTLCRRCLLVLTWLTRCVGEQRNAYVCITSTRVNTDLSRNASRTSNRFAQGCTGVRLHKYIISRADLNDMCSEYLSEQIQYQGKHGVKSSNTSWIICSIQLRDINRALGATTHSVASYRVVAFPVLLLVLLRCLIGVREWVGLPLTWEGGSSLGVTYTSSRTTSYHIDGEFFVITSTMRTIHTQFVTPTLLRASWSKTSKYNSSQLRVISELTYLFHNCNEFPLMMHKWSKFPFYGFIFLLDIVYLPIYVKGDYPLWRLCRYCT